MTVSLFFPILSGHAGGKVAVWGSNNYGQCLLPNGLKNVKAVAAGYYHNLALTADGRVLGWGRNAEGQANPPPELTGVTAIAAGGMHNLALRANGTVVAWGYNNHGQTNVPAGLSRVTAVAAGGATSLALKADGTVVAWGFGSYGLTNVPAGLTDVVAITAGSQTSFALKADGTIVAWGYLGYGLTSVPLALSNVVAISAGVYQAMALKADGTVAVWGAGFNGDTNAPPGLSNVIAIAAGHLQNVALKVDGTVSVWGYEGLGALQSPSGMSNAVAIAAGERHVVAIVPDGPPEIIVSPGDVSVSYQSNIVLQGTASGNESLGFQWRFNGGLLADTARISGTTTSSLTISNAQFSDMGSYTVVVSNALGAVQSSAADVTVVSPPLITQHPVGQTVIAGTNLMLWGAAIGTPPLSYHWRRDGAPVSGANSNLLPLTNIQSSQSGSYTLVISNAYGTNASSAALITVLESPPYILVQPTNRAVTVGGTTTFAVNARGSTPLNYQWFFNGAEIPGATNAALTLTALRYDQAGFYTVAISNAFGSVVSAKAQLFVQQVAIWGATTFGLPSNIPPDLTNLTAISTGSGFVLGLKHDGNVVLWGGLPPTALLSTNMPATVTNVIAIATGSGHCLALKSNGTVVAWGGSSTKTIVPRVPPYPYPPNLVTNVPVGLSNVIAIAAGDYHSLALTADGQVVAWGLYRPASIWSTPYSLYSVATNTPTGLSNVIAIAAGGAQNLAVKADGRVVAWGYNAKVATTNVPSSLSNVISVACTDGYNLALRTDGTVVAWPVQTVSSPFPPTRFPVYPNNTDVPPGLSNVVAIAAGNYAMALKADGSTTVWGSNAPPPPAGLSNVFAISTRGNFLAALAGDGSPRLTILPANQSATNGADVRFSARAVGIQPMTYQWLRDGEMLTGATNADLQLSMVRGSNAGVYQVVAANAAGTITSAPATLTIPFTANLAAALNATNLVWTTTPTNSPWFAQNRVTHDGEVAAQSGAIPPNGNSVLQTHVNGPGTLTFWWKVSSEAHFDFLEFARTATNSGSIPTVQATISGERDWESRSFTIPAGPQTLIWTYRKDGSVSSGEDAGWLDQVQFTPLPPLQLTAPHWSADGSFTLGSGPDRNLQIEDLAQIEIQATTNLHDWITLSDVCTLTNGALRICDPDALNHPQRFYRVIER